ncbi:MAG: DUF342 domain-containing protein [FCB group bacterium]|nr:DUF342 domain-containing protein [FCB group bacterium]
MDDFSIQNIDEGSWAFEIKIDQTDLTDIDIVKILHKAKSIISAKTNLPVMSLQYKDLVKKRSGDSTTKISVIISKDSLQKSDPVLRFERAVSNYGLEFEGMQVYLTLYPLNEKGEKTSIHDIMRVIKQNSVSIDLVDKEVIEEALIQLENENRVIKELKIAQGRFPSKSRDAEIEYSVGIMKKDDLNYATAEKVDKNQVLIRKNPPVRGSINGINVLGEEIAPPAARDIEIVSGENTTLSDDGLEILSATRGILNVHVSQTFKKDVKSKIEVSVDPIEVIDGSVSVRITADKPVEIVGNLKSGSKIISQGDVNVSGDIEANTSIQTSRSIFIEGNIIGSSLSSDQDIKADNVKSSKLLAEGKVVIKGSAMNSVLSGREVYIYEVIGCDITAAEKIEIDIIRTNESGFSASLTAGLTSHLGEIIKENVKFIVFADSNLEKLQKVFGEDIVKNTNSENVSQMMMIHAENLERMGLGISSSSQKEAIRQLIGTISPIRELREEKTNAIVKLEAQNTAGKPANPKIQINQFVEQPVDINIEGRLDHITPEDGATLVGLEGKRIVKSHV